MNMSLKLVKLLELVYLASENRTEGRKEPELEWNWCTLLQRTEQKVGKEPEADLGL